MQITNLINFLINNFKYKSYFEIGVDNPSFNYIFINCDNKECQDYFERFWTSDGYPVYLNKKNNLLGKYLTYHLPRITFCESVQNKHYDLIYINRFNDQNNGMELYKAIKMLNKDGKIIISNIEKSGWPIIAEYIKLNLPIDTVEENGDLCVIVNYVKEFDLIKEIKEFPLTFENLFSSEDTKEYYFHPQDIKEYINKIIL